MNTVYRVKSCWFIWMSAPLDTVSGSTYYFMDCIIHIIIINSCSSSSVTSLTTVNSPIWRGLCSWGAQELFLSKPASRRYFILYTSGSVTKFYCDYHYLNHLPNADNACLWGVCKCSSRFCCSETKL